MYIESLLIVLLPLLGSTILLFLPIKSNTTTSILGNIAIGIPMLLSIGLLISFLSGNISTEN